ncbi:MAG: hypothetical protein LLG00_11085 [Planctomycetaceae bacterium]|nr:hypothetical protein [Planctomycetaceae bacterium]
MPEMVPHCGCRFQVHRRAEKAFLDHHNIVVRLRNAVLLQGVRCDGRSHGGCQMNCLMFWKDAWLRPVAVGEQTANGAFPCESAVAQLPTWKDDKYRCQATELINCGSILPWWDFRQYASDYSAREMGLGDWTGMLTLLIANKLRRACGLKEQGVLVGHAERTANDGIGLKAGDSVQVKSRKEIQSTLDRSGRNRGLGFSPEMALLCNRQFRVLRRIERVIVEWSGELREIRNTVILDGATCTGMARRCCPRDCHHLWRECWLRRVG